MLSQSFEIYLETASTRSGKNVYYLQDSFHVKTWLRCHVICWVGSSHSSYHLAKFEGLAPWESKGEIFFDRSDTWLCRWGPFTLSHHSAKFGFHRPWKRGDITSLIYYMTTCLMCHLTCGWGSLILSHHSAKFGVHRPCESGDRTFFICHMTTTSKCHMNLWVGSSHLKSPPC